jgi:hypothetical protein
MEHDLQDVTPSWFRPQPRSPYQVYKPDVIRDVQRTLSCPETGVMDAVTVTHIKGLQNLFGITPTGVIDIETAVQIERLRRRHEEVLG